MKRLSPREGYDLYAGDYRKDHPHLDSFMNGAELDVWERAAAELDSESAVLALEVGCGDGRTLVRCQRRIAKRPDHERFQLWGTDLSPRMLDRARKRFDGPLAVLDVTNGTACRAWSLDHGPAHLVSAWFVLVHVASLPAFFEAMAALTAPGGLLLANSIPQPSAPELRAQGKPVVIEAWDHRPDAVTDAAEAAGWSLWDRRDFLEKGQLVSTLWGWKRPPVR